MKMLIFNNVGAICYLAIAIVSNRRNFEYFFQELPNCGKFFWWLFIFNKDYIFIKGSQVITWILYFYRYLIKTPRGEGGPQMCPLHIFSSPKYTPPFFLHLSILPIFSFTKVYSPIFQHLQLSSTPFIFSSDLPPPTVK